MVRIIINELFELQHTQKKEIALSLEILNVIFATPCMAGFSLSSLCHVLEMTYRLII